MKISGSALPGLEVSRIIGNEQKCLLFFQFEFYSFAGACSAARCPDRMFAMP